MVQEAANRLEEQAFQDSKGLKNLLVSLPLKEFAHALEALPNDSEVEKIKRRVSFLKNLGHDTDNSLTSVKGYFQILEILLSPIPEGSVQVQKNITDSLEAIDVQQLALGLGLKEEYLKWDGDEKKDPSFEDVARQIVEKVGAEAEEGAKTAKDFFHQRPSSKPNIQKMRAAIIKGLGEVGPIARSVYGEFTGDYLIRPEGINLETLIQEIEADINASHAPEGQVLNEVKVLNQSGLGSIEIDRTYLTRVLRNLLDNAAKYRKKEDQPAQVTISIQGGILAKGQKVLQISVADDGKGLTEEDLKSLFVINRYRARDSLDQGIPGSGRGMGICKNIIENVFRGQIWAESKGLGQGARFTFYLPLTEKSAQESPLNLVDQLLAKAEEKTRILELDKKKNLGDSVRGLGERGRMTVQHNLELFYLRMALLLEKTDRPLLNDPRELIKQINEATKDHGIPPLANIGDTVQIGRVRVQGEGDQISGQKEIVTYRVVSIYTEAQTSDRFMIASGKNLWDNEAGQFLIPCFYAFEKVKTDQSQ